MATSGVRAPAFLCVHCRAILSAPGDGRIACAVCRKSYPLLAGGIPLLVADPEDHTAAAVAELLRGLEYRESLIAHLESRLAAGSRRPRALQRILELVRRNAALMSRLLALLPSVWPIDELTKPRPQAPTQLNPQYLIRDWGGEPQSEATIAEVMAALRRQLAATPQRDAVLVLGAGTGRYAFELTADFAEVLALDWSIPSVLGYVLLRDQGPLELCELNEQNVATVDDLGAPVTCELLPRGQPKDAERLARLRWLVADGQQAPLTAASCSAVVSAYFSDLVPPDVLVEEAFRLLRPGGAFVHFGPLGYEQGDFEDLLTAEELCDRFAERGFTVTPTEWVPHLYWPTRRLVQPHMRAFAFAARKPESA